MVFSALNSSHLFKVRTTFQGKSEIFSHFEHEYILNITQFSKELNIGSGARVGKVPPLRLLYFCILCSLSLVQTAFSSANATINQQLLRLSQSITNYRNTESLE